MNPETRIAIIGYGVMGEAIIAGLLRQKIVSRDNIRASGPRIERTQILVERYGISAMTDNAEAARGADVVVLAVKPQRIEKTLASLAGNIKSDALVLSIVAGTPINLIGARLNHRIIVRAMPNTPAQIGEGIAVWTNSPETPPQRIDDAREILSALGQEVYMEEENYLDMATAVSGTGPAYAFIFMEAMIDAGVHLGFPRRIAEQLVVQTLRGSVDYYLHRHEHPAHLRNEVTSPGGTSAAALYYLEKAGFRTAISRAVWAAYERSQELGKGRHTQSPDKNEH